MSPCDLSRFSREFQLACACCRVAPGDADLSVIQRLLPQIDVPHFVDLVVNRHRIGPLVHATLKRLPADVLPAGLMAPLAVEAKGNALKALRAVRTHVLLDRWFGAAGIDWMPFKGSTVAQRYYGDVSLRQVNDMDVYVPQARLDDARSVLALHGYRWDPEELDWDLCARGPRHRRFVLGYHIEEQHHSAEHGRIELHWQLTDNPHLFKARPEELMQRADRLRMGDASLSVMNDEDLLLYLCEHGGRHCWFRLKWLADLPPLLDSREWDWAALLRKAERNGSAGSLLLGLALARDLFGWDVPGPLDERLRLRTSLRALLAITRTGLTSPASWWRAPVSPPMAWKLQAQLARLLLTGNGMAIASLLWRTTLTPGDLRLLKVPDRLLGMVRLVRPLLWALRYARRLAARPGP